MLRLACIDGYGTADITELQKKGLAAAGKGILPVRGPMCSIYRAAVASTTMMEDLSAIPSRSINLSCRIFPNHYGGLFIIDIMSISVEAVHLVLIHHASPPKHETTCSKPLILRRVEQELRVHMPSTLHDDFPSHSRGEDRQSLISTATPSRL